MIITPTIAAVNPGAPRARTGPSIAFLLGASDGDANAPFAPEMFFVRRVDKIAYAFGYEASQGATESTRQFTASVNWETK